MTDQDEFNSWDDEFGGPIQRPRLDFMWIVDRSNSMASDGKMASLNNAVRDAVPLLRAASEENPHIDVFVHALAFSTGAAWHIPETPVADFHWEDLEPAGYTDLGEALAMAATKLAEIRATHTRVAPPVLVLLSDGLPTDEYGTGLKALLREPLGGKAVRLAVAIGRDADHESLRRFIDHVEIDVFEANSPQQLFRFVRWASTLVTEGSQAGIQRGDAPTKVPTSAGGSSSGEPETW